MDNISSKDSTESNNGRFEAIEIPLYVHPKYGSNPSLARDVLKSKTGVNNIAKLVQLQEILYSEEKSSFNSNVSSSSAITISPLSRIHSNAVYLKSLSRLLEFSTFPLLSTLQQIHLQNQAKASFILLLLTLRLNC